MRNKRRRLDSSSSPLSPGPAFDDEDASRRRSRRSAPPTRQSSTSLYFTCEACGGRSSNALLMTCNECNTSKIHTSCLQQLDSPSRTRSRSRKSSSWVCSQCQIQRSGGLARSRTLRTRTVAFEDKPENVQNLDSEISDAPDVIEDVDLGDNLEEDVTDHDEEHEDNGHLPEESDAEGIREAEEDEYAGRTHKSPQISTPATANEFEVDEMADLPIDPELMRHRSYTAESEDDPFQQHLDENSVPRRRRGRPRIYPVGVPRSQRPLPGLRRSPVPEVVTRLRERPARPVELPREGTRLRDRTAGARSSRRKAHRRHVTRPLHTKKLVSFDRSRSSLVAKFNLVRLASHVDIHHNNLGISGYLTYDHTDKHVYVFAADASAADGDREKPYGGLLSARQADTSRTVPTSFDRMIFGKTLLLAKQQERRTELGSRTSTSRKPRNRRRHNHEDESSEDEYLDGTPKRRFASLQSAADSPASQSSGFSLELEDSSSSTYSDEEDEIESDRESQSVSKIRTIRFGNYEIETWYTAPYPEEYNRRSLLYICEFCLKYMPSEYVNWRHQLKCPMRHPPGDEIYRSGKVSVFEVDGRKNPMYCQNLCLLAKLFLGSKTLYYDVEPFLFYIMVETDELGCHFVGYFSKEKRNTSSYNVSCILTLPVHQRKGYGNFLIAFSYLLSRAEGKTGTPEKPLSDLGLLSYRNYWKHTLCYELHDIFLNSTPLSSISIADLSARTGMTLDDVVSGLEALNALVRDPATDDYIICVDKGMIEKHIAEWESKGYISLDPTKLVWTPLVVGRSGGINSLYYAPDQQVKAENGTSGV